MQIRKNRKSIVFTGGHAATTAMGVVEEIKKQKKDWDLHWIGTKRAIEGRQVISSFESEILPRAGVEFHPIVTGRLQRRISPWTVPSLTRVPVGFFQSMRLLARVRPSLILSFGGFASVPVVLAGWVLRIPVILHEQTAAVGLANKLSIPFAKMIAISRLESAKYFPKKKVRLVGIPIMQNVSKLAPKERMGEPPTIYITGGSRGSQNLNSLILQTLEKLLNEFNLIHQTGPLDIEKISKVKESLPEKMQQRYEIFANKSHEEIASLYKKADIVIARAGANTVAEIGQAARPAIFIPIPWARESEQQKNAEVLEKAGGAYILNQEGANGEMLYELVKKTVKNWEKMVDSLRKISGRDKKAASTLVNLMEEFIREN